jgi:hypothetical protein
MTFSIHGVTGMDITESSTSGKDCPVVRVTNLTIHSADGNVDVTLFSKYDASLPIDDLRASFHKRIEESAEQMPKVDYEAFHELIAAAEEAKTALRENGLPLSAHNLHKAILKAKTPF